MKKVFAEMNLIWTKSICRYVEIEQDVASSVRKVILNSVAAGV